MNPTRRNQLSIGFASNVLTMAMAFNIKLLNDYPSQLADLLYNTNRKTLNDTVVPEDPENKSSEENSYTAESPDDFSRNTQSGYGSNESSYSWGRSRHPNRCRPKCASSQNTQSICKNQGSMQYDDEGASICSKTFKAHSKISKSLENFINKINDGTFVKENTNYSDFDPGNACGTKINQTRNVTGETYNICASPEQSANKCGNATQILPQNAQLDKTIKAIVNQYLDLSEAEKNIFVESFIEDSDNNDGDKELRLDPAVKSIIWQFRELSPEEQNSFVQSLEDPDDTNTQCVSENFDNTQSNLSSNIEELIKQFQRLKITDKKLFVECLQSSKENSSEQSKISKDVDTIVKQYLDLSQEEKISFIDSFNETENNQRCRGNAPANKSPKRCAQECNPNNDIGDRIVNNFLDLSNEEKILFVDSFNESDNNQMCRGSPPANKSPKRCAQQCHQNNDIGDDIVNNFLDLSNEEKISLIDNLTENNQMCRPCAPAHKSPKRCAQQCNQKNDIGDDIINNFLDLSPEQKILFVDGFKGNEVNQRCNQLNRSEGMCVDECQSSTDIANKIVDEFLKLSEEEKKKFIISFKEHVNRQKCQAVVLQNQPVCANQPAINCCAEQPQNNLLDNILKEFLELTKCEKLQFLNGFDEATNCREEPPAECEIQGGTTSSSSDDSAQVTVRRADENNESFADLLEIAAETTAKVQQLINTVRCVRKSSNCEKRKRCTV